MPEPQPRLTVPRSAPARWLAVAVSSWIVLAASPSASQIVDPVPEPILFGDRAVRVEFVVQMPDSGSQSSPRARPMVLRGDGGGRNFVADQNGIIYQLHSDDSLSVFLDVGSETDLFADQGQRGVSSFAFHPDFATPGTAGEGKFYTASSQDSGSGTPDHPVPAGAPTSHHSVIHEWEVHALDPDAIDPTSIREVLRIGNPYNGHNIGEIDFNPNAVPGDDDLGFLYIALGDGGSPTCCPPLVDFHVVGQDLSSPLGKLLRIDPLEDLGDAYTVPTDNPFADDGDAATLAEIYAYGLRNPHRFSWDSVGTGPLLLSDIGAGNIEEINRIEKSGNYGWSEREGTFLVDPANRFDVFALPANDATFGFSYPVIQYDHDGAGSAVSGGYVPRLGPVKQIRNRYVFGDLVSGQIFTARATDLRSDSQSAFEELRLIDTSDSQVRGLLEMIGGGPPAPRADLRFGLDEASTVYLLTKNDGSIRRIVATPQCRDGLDNDGDGLVDYDGGTSVDLSPTAPDPFCNADPTAAREGPVKKGCGLGGLAAASILLPAAGRRRVRRAP